jgi:hypothetical protein
MPIDRIHYLCKFVPTREELTTKSTKSAKFFCSFSFVFFAFFVVRQKSANIVEVDRHAKR